MRSCLAVCLQDPWGPALSFLVGAAMQYAHPDPLAPPCVEAEV